MQESQVYVWDGRVDDEGLEFCASPWLHFISQGGGSQTWSQDHQQHRLELFRNANPQAQHSVFLRRPLVASLMHTKVWEPLSKGERLCQTWDTSYRNWSVSEEKPTAQERHLCMKSVGLGEGRSVNLCFPNDVWEFLFMWPRYLLTKIIILTHK